MKGRAIVPLVLGLVVGLVAVKFGVDAVRSAQGSSQMNEKITAVRAKQDIAAFQKITPDLVELFQTIDPQFAPNGERIPKLEDAIGRVTGKAIPLNAPVLKSMLAPEGTPVGMVGRIPPGFRAVSVKIDEASSVSYHLRPGVWVDVTVVMDVMSGQRGRKDTISEVILQRVQVAAVGKGSQSESDAGARGVRSAKSVTLFVKEGDVPKLHLAGTRGKISLSMRGEDEGIVKETATASESDLTGYEEVAKVEPAVRPAPKVTKAVDPEPVETSHPYQVIVFRGVGVGDVQRITFENERSSRVVESSTGLPTRATSALRSNYATGSQSGGGSGFGSAPTNADTSGTNGNTFDSGH